MANDVPSQFEKDRGNTKLHTQLARLQQQQKRIDEDLEHAEDTLKHVTSQHRDVDRAMAHIKMRHGDLVSLESKLHTEQAQQQREFAILSTARIQAEKSAAVSQVKRTKQQQEDEEVQRVRIADKAKRDQQAAAKLQQFSQRNSSKIHKEKVAKEEATKLAATVEHQRRIATVLQLKREIESDSNKDVRAANHRKKQQQQKAALEAAERDAILAQMGNPDAVFRERELREQQDAARAAQASKRRAQELAIIEKLQNEEKRRTRAKQQSNSSASTRTAPKSHETAVKANATAIKPNMMPAAPMTDSESDGEQQDVLQERTNSDDDGDLNELQAISKRMSTLAVLDEDDDALVPSGELFIEPEFADQWAAAPAKARKISKQFIHYVASDDEGDQGSDAKPKYNLTTKPLSKLEQDKMAAALTWQRENIAQKQVGCTCCRFDQRNV